MKVDIVGIGLLAPGLNGWEAGRAVLAGLHQFEPAGVPDPEAALLPPNERRRSSDSVRWAVHVAQQAIGQSGLNPHDMPTVFASSDGEMHVFDKLSRTLATPERLISPTLFHQSVHNTAAGYWGIATTGQASSTALSCYDDSFAAGLLEAVTMVSVERCPVLLVVYDLDAPTPLREARPITSGFAVAMALIQESERPIVRMQVRLEEFDGREVNGLEDTALEQVRRDNPAARSLPLLRAIAACHRQIVKLKLLDAQQIIVDIESCRN